MTAVPGVKDLPATSEKSKAASQGRSFWGRFGIHIVLVILMVIWLLPTIGLFVNSFRDAQSINASGWWTALFPPKNLTLDNYATVLAGQNPSIVDGFVNSLFITIPATIIPIFIAAFAAYAFA